MTSQSSANQASPRVLTGPGLRLPLLVFSKRQTVRIELDLPGGPRGGRSPEGSAHSPWTEDRGDKERGDKDRGQTREERRQRTGDKKRGQRR
ncbi:hypothetical protein EYF80_066034 [Liparis tanakae]|uniref:Uncharacterized protein n=1 Tax=Liparis tanakae TaxID=230148 RepID=A0A4Z2E5F5_9TELE|nr:hypothetical protein EYF80_066034 [Liparis tanakae]